MRPPTTRVNTYVKETKETQLDRTSKIFILIELICGVNRLPVFGKIKPILLVLSFIISASINVFVIYSMYYKFSQDFKKIIIIVKLSQYIACALLGCAFRKRLNDFYFELCTFDKEINFTGVIKDVIKNLIQACLTVGFLFFLFVILHGLRTYTQYYFDIMIILLAHVLELHFFGHLLSQLIPRLRCIRYLMKQSFVVTELTNIDTDLAHTTNRQHSPDMKKLMDYYHRIIIAFDTLNDAIKWQMLIILVTTFVSTLDLSYYISLQLIRNEYEVINVLTALMLALIELTSMFAPCRVVDAVHGEARSIIELLSSKLYGNKIDKSSRPVAQALLALMEARDMSLSLFRVFDIDVSFPFKFLGLLVTYLIILLQFEKVINLDRSTS